MRARFESFSEKNHSDQRYFPRWVVTTPVLYKDSQTAQLQSGQTKDLSCSGACISFNDPLPLNGKVKLIIRLSPAENIEVSGRVIWQHASSHGNLTGISFYNTSDAVQDKILQHAFEIDREEIVKHWFDGWENR